MKISCVIPTKDRCRMVLEAVASVKRQQRDDLEIILVDDDSSDNTIAEVSSRFPEVTVVRSHGTGPGAARNAGVAASGNDVLMFLDSDDIWLENHVEQLAAALDRGFNVAYGVTYTKNMVGTADFLIPENGTGPDGDCFNALLRWCFLVPSALAVRRETFYEVGGFDAVAPGEDWIFLLKLAACHPFGFAGTTPITLRRLHRGSLCFLRDGKKLLAILVQILNLLEREPRATPAHRKHFEKLHAWTAANAAQWSTVQDWYTSLIKEKII